MDASKYQCPQCDNDIEMEKLEEGLIKFSLQS